MERGTPADPFLEVVEAQTPTQTASGVRPHTVAGLSVLCAVCGLLGWQRLHTRYWIDEALTVGIASHPLTAIPSALANDGSPPLYYLALSVWTRLFGTSEVATHSLSLVLAIAIVPVSFWAGQRIFDRRAAWFAATFAAIMPFISYFSGETRMYELVVLESILVSVAFVDAFVTRTRSGPWWFAVTCLLLVYSHYWGLYTMVGAAVAVAVLAWRSAAWREYVRPAAIGFGVVVAGFLPWLPSFAEQAQSTGAPWSHTPTLRGLVGEVAALVRDERVLVILVVVVGLGLASMWRELAGLRVRRPLSGAAQRVLGLVLLTSSPVVLGWLVAHLQPSWATRYLAVVVGPMVLVVGYGLARARAAGVVGLALVGILVLQPLTRISPGIGISDVSKSNAYQMASSVKAAVPAGSVVLVTQPEAVPLMAYYLGDSYRYADPRGFVRDPSMMDWRDATAELDRASVPGPLGSVVDSPRSGDRLLLVSAGRPARNTDTAWIERFTELDRAWSNYLRTATCFRPTARTAPSEPSDFPFSATVFTCS